MTKPAMTGHQADALARFVVALRPGQRRWTQTTVAAALYQAAKQRTNDTETLARAAIRAALTAGIIGPEVIPMPGAHWESVNHSPAHEPQRASRCQECHDMHMPDAPCTDATADAEDHITQLRRAVRPMKRYDADHRPIVTTTELPEETM